MSWQIFMPARAQRLTPGNGWSAQSGESSAGPVVDLIGSPFDSAFHGGDASAEAGAPKTKNWLVSNFEPTVPIEDEPHAGVHSGKSMVSATRADDAIDPDHVAKSDISSLASRPDADPAPSSVATSGAPVRQAPIGANETVTVGARTETVALANADNLGAFDYEPAFPLPVDDFDIIPPPPTHSIGEGNLHELMDHLNRGGAKWDPTDPDGGVTLRVAFPQEYDDIPLHFRTLDGLDTPVDAWAEGLDFFDAEQQSFALQALQAWADIANVRFELVAPGEEADIYFYGKDFDAGGGVSSGIHPLHGSRIAINVADGWPDIQPGATSFRLLMHEIGHSLGLTHPSDYDLGDYKGYNWDAEYIEDTRMYSIMSYNSGTYTGLDPGGLNPGGVTPRSHDIYVIQELYGANWETRSGDSTYGYNASGVGALFDFDNYGGAGEFDPPLFTIWDGGGEDWLDLSGDASSVTLDLRPGTFSSSHGMTYNISLAYVPDNAPDDLAGYIENARGGAGNDSITGNAKDNELLGNDGNDVLSGLAGDDTLKGGSGNDTLIGGTGDDKLIGGGGDDVLNGGWGIDWAIFGDVLFGGVTVDLLKGTQRTGAGGIDTLLSVENVGGTRYADSLKGSELANELLGDDGNDLLWGNGGADVIVGGRGNDQMWGGAGADRYEFASGWGDDRIADFEVGIDKLDFTGLTGPEALLKIGIQSTPLGVLVTCGEQSILLAGVTAIPAHDLLM